MNTRMIEIWMVSGEYGKIGFEERFFVRKIGFEERFFVRKIGCSLPHDFSDRKNWIRRTIFREKNWMLPHDFSDRKN